MPNATGLYDLCYRSTFWLMLGGRGELTQRLLVNRLRVKDAVSHQQSSGDMLQCIAPPVTMGTHCQAVPIMVSSHHSSLVAYPLMMETLTMTCSSSSTARYRPASRSSITGSHVNNKPVCQQRFGLTKFMREFRGRRSAAVVDVGFYKIRSKDLRS